MNFNYDSKVANHTEAWGQIDQGLRKYMLQVYNFMALGLAITGIVAFFVASSPMLIKTIFFSPLRWVVMLAPIGLALFLSMRIRTLNFATAQLVFWIYSAAMGLSLSILFIAFTSESIARTFFISASLFGGMSLYGYTTKKDLSQWGSFLFMGLMGIVLAGLVNLFVGSSAFQTMISMIAVIVFTGLTAYDVQKIKDMYFDMDTQDVSSKKALFGALQLYMNFINLFVHLLHLLGDRK